MGRPLGSGALAGRSGSGAERSQQGSRLGGRRRVLSQGRSGPVSGQWGRAAGGTLGAAEASWPETLGPGQLTGLGILRRRRPQTLRLFAWMGMRGGGQGSNWAEQLGRGWVGGRSRSKWGLRGPIDGRVPGSEDVNPGGALGAEQTRDLPQLGPEGGSARAHGCGGDHGVATR